MAEWGYFFSRLIIQIRNSRVPGHLQDPVKLVAGLAMNPALAASCSKLKGKGGCSLYLIGLIAQAYLPERDGAALDATTFWMRFSGRLIALVALTDRRPSDPWSDDVIEG